MERREGADGRPARASVCVRCCQRLCGTVFSSVGICVIILGYIVMGAFVFMYVEGGAEAEQLDRAAATRAAVDETVSEARLRAVEKLWDITVALNVLHKTNWTSLTSRQLQKFQAELMQAAQYNNTEPVQQRWGFCGSFLYSLTVITTIGYGTCSPRTDAGKLLTIAYAVLGIPLMLLYLSNIGDILARCLKFLCNGCCFCRPLQRKKNIPIDAYRPPMAPPPPRLNHIDGDLKHQHHHHHHHELLERGLEEAALSLPVLEPSSALPFCMCLVAMLAYMLGGGYLLTLWEDWSYLDGAFFCFVSLSTIGFGELTPGGGGGAASAQLVAALYLLLGMALIAMCFNLMQEQAVCLVRCVARKLGVMSEPEDEPVS